MIILKMIQKLSILFFLVTISLNSFAQSKIGRYQQSDIQSLLDSAKSNSRHDVIRAYNFVEQALEMIIQNGDKENEIRAYSILGEINFYSEQYDLSIENYFKAISLSERLNKPTLAYNSKKWIGVSFKANNDLDKAIFYLNSFLTHSAKNLPNDDIVFIKIHLAETYELKGELKLAEETYKEVLSIEQSRNNNTGILFTQDRLARINLQRNNPASAIQYYEKSEQIAQESSDKKSLANALRGKSAALKKQNKPEEELSARQQALDINTELNDVEAQNVDLLELGKIYIEQKEEEKAIPLLQRSIDLSNETKNITQKKEALYTLSKAYERSDVNMALSTYKEYLKVNESINKKREQELLSRLELATSLNRKQQRIDLLEKDKELNDKTIDLLLQEQVAHEQFIDNQKKTIYLLVIILVILFISSVLILRSAKQKRLANQLLALKSLRSQMNPHFIFNALNSVNSYIAKKDELSANRYLSDFAFLMRSVLENSKHDFIPLTDEIKIIELYVKLEHERFKEKFDYSFTVDEDINTELFLIPPMLIQPYIENAVWHGLRYKEEKGFLIIDFKQVDKNLQIIIKDNGVGRNKSMELKTKNQQQNNSTGIKNIENRLKIINEVHRLGIRIDVSDLDLVNQTGTIVSILLPMKIIN
jgi:tetratricopeptide (TPR) repeat protein